MMDATQPILLSRKKAALALDVSVRTIDRWLKSGEIPAVRIGGIVRIPYAWLVERCTSTSTKTGRAAKRRTGGQRSVTKLVGCGGSPHPLAVPFEHG